MVNESLELLKRIRQLLKDVKPEYLPWDNLKTEMDVVIAKSESTSVNKSKKSKVITKSEKPKKGKKARKEPRSRAIVDEEIDFFKGIE